MFRLALVLTGLAAAIAAAPGTFAADGSLAGRPALAEAEAQPERSAACHELREMLADLGEPVPPI